MDSEDILKVLCDSLHYPDFNNAWERLNLFEQKQLSQEIQDIVNGIYREGYEDYEEEERSAFNEGYENGINDGIDTAEDIIIKYVEDFELRDKLLEELEKNES